MKPEKIAILANAASRTLNKSELEATVAHINKFLPCEIVYTQSIEQARAFAADLSGQPEYLVAACGGDGTIHTVQNSMVTDAAMGIIPAGTANVIARELGIPLKMIDAGKLLLTGAVQETDLGTCNGHKFIFVAGIGFDAQVAGSVSPLLKKVAGRYAYHINGLLQFLTYRAPQLRIKIEGQSREETGRFAIIANMRRYGGELFFAPSARYDDGMLNMVLVKNFDTKTMLRLLNFARGNGPFPTSGVSAISAPGFEIKSSFPVPFELDGEVYAPATDFSISIAHDRARLITP
ncbi:MAG: YegS/Rv2252/BmrU family lipid kinase [Candidatus Riflebacteria bacterium]|nr:YegS/Rv2252/BmrU family lipid kinase [Candidatus Riflebacteria bacterium]